jgi:glutaredoxin
MIESLPNLVLLTRPGCGLCEDAARDLNDLGAVYEEVDVDSDPELQERYGDAIPALLFGGRELARAPMTPSTIRAALAGTGVSRRESRVRWV